VHRATELTAELPEITKSVVHHVQTSLGRAPYNIDDFGAYQAAALSVRDNLIVSPCLATVVPGLWLEFLLIAYVYWPTSSLFSFLYRFSHFSHVALCSRRPLH
jgi:hypothetical protein